MTAESFRANTTTKQEISYSWFEAHPLNEGSVYFWKLNKFLERETFGHRWWIVNHKDTGRTLAQGLWTHHEARSFVRNIKWQVGQFYLPKENYSISYSMGDAIYSCKTSGVVVRALCREKILEREQAEDGLNIKYFPRLNILEGLVASFYGDKLYTVKIRPTLDEPGKVWFDLRTPINI